MSGHQNLEFVVQQAQHGMRLDLALVQLAADMSRRKIRNVIDVGGCYINRKRVRMASRPVNKGDRILLQFSETGLKKLANETFALTADDILYNKHEIIAVNKPPGIPAQATRDQAIHHMAIYVRDYLRANNISRKEPQPVHRLDKETSGVMLFALSTNAMDWLTEQFKSRDVRKTYLAISYGLIPQPTFEVKCFLSQIDKRTGDVTIVGSGGKASQTYFDVLAVNKALELSLIKCKPVTGRSHQIRVHLLSRGLPIVGDKRYGSGAGRSSKISAELRELAGKHHFLHAQTLEFIPVPGGDTVKIEASLPAAMAAFKDAASFSSSNVAGFELNREKLIPRANPGPVHRPSSSDREGGPHPGMRVAKKGPAGPENGRRAPNVSRGGDQGGKRHGGDGSRRPRGEASKDLSKEKSKETSKGSSRAPKKRPGTFPRKKGRPKR